MLLRTLIHLLGEGWPAPLPTQLDGPSTLVLAFGASVYAEQPQALAEIAAAFPSSVIAGCSTSGEIAGARVCDASISVAVASFERSTLARAIAEVRRVEDSHAAGQSLASQLPHEGLRAVFVLSDGLHVNGSALVAGIAEGLPAGVAISGGLAGDGARFERTWVLDGATPRQRHVCAVGLYGEHLRIGCGHDGGWSDFGPERRITRSAGNVLYELDGRPALDLYRSYLGERAAGLPGSALLFPLAIRRPGSADASIVRTILGIDEAARTMTFAGDMPEGAVARLMRTSNDRLIDSAAVAASRAVRRIDASPAPLVISVSCVGRRLVLGERTEEEVETVVDGTPDAARHVGFYSYGEISPTLDGGASELHNQTMTVTVLDEVC